MITEIVKALIHRGFRCSVSAVRRVGVRDVYSFQCMAGYSVSVDIADTREPDLYAVATRIHSCDNGYRYLRYVAPAPGLPVMPRRSLVCVGGHCWRCSDIGTVAALYDRGHLIIIPSPHTYGLYADMLMALAGRVSREECSGLHGVKVLPEHALYDRGET